MGLNSFNGAKISLNYLFNSKLYFQNKTETIINISLSIYFVYKRIYNWKFCPLLMECWEMFISLFSAVMKDNCFEFGVLISMRKKHLLFSSEVTL